MSPRARRSDAGHPQLTHRDLLVDLELLSAI